MLQAKLKIQIATFEALIINTEPISNKLTTEEQSNFIQDLVKEGDITGGVSGESSQNSAYSTDVKPN